MNLSLNLFYIIKKMIDSRLVKVMIILQAFLSCPNYNISKTLSRASIVSAHFRPETEKFCLMVDNDPLP